MGFKCENYFLKVFDLTTDFRKKRGINSLLFTRKPASRPILKTNKTRVDKRACLRVVIFSTDKTLSLPVYS